MLNCTFCGKEISKLYGRYKYCSLVCKEKNRGEILTCRFCKKEFKGRSNRIFCSTSCFGKTRIDYIIKKNKDRRKYDLIPGKTRQQIYWLNNSESRMKHLQRDIDKRFKVIEYLGNKCSHCGYCKDKRALVLDHINSDGKLDRKEKGSRLYRYYVNNLEEAKVKIQILCANCNLIKSFEKNEHNISRRVVKNK